MPETTPLIKAALNLRGGAGFDVYFQAPQPHFRKSIVFTATNAMKTMLSASLMEQYSILVFNNLK